jgi:hypothetical protein
MRARSSAEEFRRANPVPPVQGLFCRILLERGVAICRRLHCTHLIDLPIALVLFGPFLFVAAQVGKDSNRALAVPAVRLSILGAASLFAFYLGSERSGLLRRTGVYVPSQLSLNPYFERQRKSSFSDQWNQAVKGCLAAPLLRHCVLTAGSPFRAVIAVI